MIRAKPLLNCRINCSGHSTLQPGRESASRQSCCPFLQSHLHHLSSSRPSPRTPGFSPPVSPLAACSLQSVPPQRTPSLPVPPERLRLVRQPRRLRVPRPSPQRSCFAAVLQTARPDVAGCGWQRLGKMGRGTGTPARFWVTGNATGS